MFVNARKQRDYWGLFNQWGHEMRLPSLPVNHAGTVQIGTLGTRFEAKINAATGNKTNVMVRLIKSLNRPVYLIDTRRSGTGALGSWSPLEFASIIRAELGTSPPYAFVHLPMLAPSIRLLAEERRGELAGWRVFRDRYNAELSGAAVTVAQAFVEAAALRDGLAVFLCAEPYCAAFDQLPADAQDTNHCHRFNLARRVADAIKADHPGAVVQRVDLDAAAFVTALVAARGYEPEIRPL